MDSYVFRPLRLRTTKRTTNYPALRIYPVNHPWEGDDLANVLSTADPSHRALQAKPKTGVGNAAVAP